MRLALALVVLCCACKVPDDDPLSIGRFEVVATRTESCGDQVYLASPTTQTFWVFLRKTSDTVVLWDDGSDRWPLSLDAEGQFSGAAQMTATMDAAVEALPEEPPDPWDAWEEEEPEEAGACVMLRLDQVEGQLFEASFEGVLKHSFAAQDGSDCSALMAPPLPLADSLPCTVSFDLEATKIP